MSRKWWKVRRDVRECLGGFLGFTSTWYALKNSESLIDRIIKLVKDDE